MTRLLVHVEGQTEETFVNEVLRPHLIAKGFSIVAARLLGNARLRERRGGIKGWQPVRRDISRHLLGDTGSYATTMVDYYALPKEGDKAWPGRSESVHVPAGGKAAVVEDALMADFAQHLSAAAAIRFVPFVLMHEFEALLFSDCATFAASIDQAAKEEALSSIRSAFASPEEINDSPHTAPSKRVEAIIDGYQKPLHGNIAALSIGLEKIRAECPHFDAWVMRLEALV